MEITWSVPKQATLAIEIWVYNALSGQTHLLNILAYEVLQQLQKGPETISSLVSKLCFIFEVEDKVELSLQAQKLMGEFENLGLIESTECEN